MLISINDLEYEEGKVKYEDERLERLREKISPKKTAPFYVEITKGSLTDADILVSSKENLLDLLIPDIEKAEKRILNTRDEEEKNLMHKLLGILEEETPLSQKDWPDSEMKKLRALGMISLKPVLLVDKGTPVQDFLRLAMQASKTIFFYTAGPKEVHAWDMKEGATAVECAGKIHSDLEKGFVRADVVSFDEFMECHNMSEAKSKGIARVVEKDFIISDGDVIEIRSSL